jgi:SWI/SNF chromatin-remodeling complex subunit SWI1
VNLIGGSVAIHSAAQGGEAGIDYDGQLYVGPDFQLNNQSGAEGPEGMGGMSGEMGAQMPGEMGGQMPGQMGGEQGGPGMNDGQQPRGNMPGRP